MSSIILRSLRYHLSTTRPTLSAVRCNAVLSRCASTSTTSAMPRHIHSSGPASTSSTPQSNSATLSMENLMFPLFQYAYRPGPLSREEVDQFHRDGFMIKRQYYSANEMKLLLKVAKADRDMDDAAIAVLDAKGNTSKLTVWNDVGNDLYSMISRGERMVNAMEQLLGDEVYHYHSKMMLKEPLVGGAWEWHQDYGYWYKNGCLFPRMASGLIAVDRASRANGCLQVLKGSHHLGRIEHGTAGGQTGADMRAVEAAFKTMEHVYIESEPGDILFFHCNTLHSSEANLSDYPRWSFICCYNAKSNNPIRASHHPMYTKLHKVPDTAILEWGQQHEDMSMSDRPEFLDPDTDESTPGSTKAKK